MFTSEKNRKQLTVSGGGGGVIPYGQPDRKISVFFDDFPNYFAKFPSFILEACEKNC